MAGQKTTGKVGLGVILELMDLDSPPGFAPVTNMVNMEVAGVTLNLVDATHLNSPNYYGEFLPGLKSSQPWTGTLQYDGDDPTQNEQTGLRQRLESRELTTLRVNMSGIGVAKGFEAEGYITELGNISLGAESVMTQTFGFQPTGRVEVVTLPVTP